MTLPTTTTTRRTAAAQAKKRIRPLWQTGDVFHVTSRYPQSTKVPRVDRLAGILKRGLVAPGRCEQGTVHPNIKIRFEGAAVAYDTLVFFHRVCPWSRLYIAPEPGRFTVLIDPAHPVLTPQEMGEAWAVLCPDEVYVQDRVPSESLTGIVVDPADAHAVLDEFQDDFRRLAIPLYNYEGRVLWPSSARPARADRRRGQRATSGPLDRTIN